MRRPICAWKGALAPPAPRSSVVTGPKALPARPGLDGVAGPTAVYREQAGVAAVPLPGVEHVDARDVGAPQGGQSAFAFRVVVVRGHQVAGLPADGVALPLAFHRGRGRRERAEIDCHERPVSPSRGTLTTPRSLRPVGSRLSRRALGSSGPVKPMFPWARSSEDP